MLIEFKVENFRSIREEQILSFVGSNYSDELPDNYHTPDLPGMADVRLVKAAAIYGANASGKSNVVKALAFLAGFVSNSFGFKLEASTGVTPFLFEAEWAVRPTLFEITFLIENTRYIYGLGLTPERVTEEYLIACPPGKTAQTWFERAWNQETEKYTWSKPNAHFAYEGALKKATRDNCAFLSTGPQFNHPQLARIQKWFYDHLWCFNADDHLIPDGTARGWLDAPSEVRRALVLFLRSADLGILDVFVEEIPLDPPPWAKFSEKQERRSTFDIKLRHKSNSNDAWLKLAEQSHGTQRLFALFYPIFYTLRKGSLLCFDEIETGFHPFMAREIIKLFLEPKVNTKNAQLLFTTHNPILLDQELLRRDQFWFTEKDDTGATRLYSLLDYSPRKGEALMKGYLAGRYGAVPFIPEGLIKP